MKTLCCYLIRESSVTVDTIEVPRDTTESPGIYRLKHYGSVKEDEPVVSSPWKGCYDLEMVVKEESLVSTAVNGSCTVKKDVRKDVGSSTDDVYLYRILEREIHDEEEMY